MTHPKPRARLRALLGRLTMAAASLSASPALARSSPPIPSLPSDDPGDDDDARAAHAHSVAISLTHMPPLDAVAAASEWALSPDPARRLAVALALTWSFPLVGDDVVIDHLSRDEHAPIRTAAARAAWARRAAGGDPGVLQRLSTDPSASVREVAWLALRG